MMVELSIRLSVLNSKTFATKVIADIVSNGTKVKTYEARVFEQISEETVIKMAEEIKTDIERKLNQALKSLCENDPELLSSTYMGTPYRVLLDPEVLIKSLRIVPIAKGYAVTFRQTKYPKTKVHVSEVAHWLNEGTDRILARPFLDMTESDFNSLVNKYVGTRRVETKEPTPEEIERVGKLVGEITGTNPLEEPKKSFVKSIISSINTIWDAGKRTDKTKK